SVHSTAEAEEAVRLGADYLIAGPVFPTSCKPGREPEGIGFLGRVVSETDIPVYAIGGIGVHNIRLVARAGAAGACIRSGFMTEDDPGSLVKRLRRAAGSGRPGRD
ncbi:MAG: thiamine phosphate synthase, partial [Gudongella sp.]|nr:thiamine phosphate synthase [Gudongella sp.]